MVLDTKGVMVETRNKDIIGAGNAKATGCLSTCAAFDVDW